MKHKKYNINYKDDAGHVWKNARRDIHMEWQRRPWLIWRVGFRGKNITSMQKCISQTKYNLICEFCFWGLCLSIQSNCTQAIITFWLHQFPHYPFYWMGNWSYITVFCQGMNRKMLCPFNPHCNKLTLAKFVGMEEIAHDRLFGDDKGFQGNTGGIQFHKDPSGNIWIFLQRRFLIRYVICLPKFVVIT